MIRTLFAAPEWLHLLWIVPALWVLRRAYLKWRENALSTLGPSASRLISGFSLPEYRRKSALLIGALVVLAFVMANPLWGVRKAQQSQKAADVIIAFDISKSMLADDLRPSRLVRARVFAQELLKQISGNRVGLVFFAGDAYRSMPLSTDYGTLNSLLAEADPLGYSAQGTAIAAAMERAQEGFDTLLTGGRAIVLITDGENHEDYPINAIETARNEGIVTYIVGAGTEEGGQIPLPGGGVQHDDNGDPVRTRTDVALLQQMADEGDGGPLMLLSRNDAPQQLAQRINDLPRREIEIRAWDERNSIYQWLLLPVILLFFGLMYRR